MAADLEQFLAFDETAADLFKRISVEPLRTGVAFLDRRVRLRPNHLLLISGQCATGKTEVLLQTAATCCLPKQWQGYELGGQEEVGVLIDLDLKCDLLRLVQILRGRIASCLGLGSGALDGQDLEAAVGIVLQDCLSRFHVVTCASSREFLAVLRVFGALQSNLQERAQLLLIDNLTANAALDRACRGHGALDPQHISETAADHLRAILSSRVTVIATQRVLASQTQGHPSSLHRRLAPPGVWQGTITQHVLLYRQPANDPAAATTRVHWLLPYDEQPQGDQFHLGDGQHLV